MKARLGVRNLVSFLAQSSTHQSSAWLSAWADFESTLTDGVTILGLHATYVSGVLGLRCPVNIPKICEVFRPSVIVSLIDDISSMWARTEARAGGKDYKGRPSFEQLLVARRAEQFLGDLLVSHAGAPRTRHLLCAAGNCLDALANVIIFDAEITYLSFPISAPRRLAANGDNSFIQLINKAHGLALAQMRTNRRRAFVSPLAIDELPLVAKLPLRENGDEHEVEFDYDRDRWSLADLWGEANATILPTVGGKHVFPISQVKDAAGVIRTDVGWRDRRLVQQASSLAIVCPKPPNENRITRGVKEEIEMAVPMGIICRYWQEPSWDPDDFLRSEFPVPGSMGGGQAQALFERKDTLEELIQATN